MIYLNGDMVNVTLFPDNTSQVWKLDESHLTKESIKITWEYSHEGEIMQLAQLKQLLDLTIDRVYLYIDYLPYGRQDKSVSNDSTFALYTFAKILNTLNFTEIWILDPHSVIALGAIRKSRAVYPHSSLRQAIRATTSNLLCYPDSGAVDKYMKVYDDLDHPSIYGKKVRDQTTGYITSYELVGDPWNSRVIIVDDICDGGKTFELLAHDLYETGAEEVNLFVTHGLFSKGLRPLFKAGISRIFTYKGEAVQMAEGGFGFRKIETAPYDNPYWDDRG